MARPSTPLISRIGAVEAALAVIDARGLEALSLQEVACKLGVKAPSLYHHFADKAELLEEVARYILLQVEAPKIRPGEDWQESLVRLCMATKREILKHPNAAPLLLQVFPRRVMPEAYDRWFSLVDAPPELHLLISEGSEKLLMGAALFAAAAISRNQSQIPKFDPQALPHFARAVSRNAYEEDAMFEETIRSFLRGLPEKAPRRRAAAGTFRMLKKTKAKRRARSNKVN